MKDSDTTITIVDPIKYPQWNSMVSKEGHGTVFHTSNWARVLVESYDFHPAYILLMQQGEFRGCLPIMEVDSILTGKRGVSLSFSDCCGAIAHDSQDYQLLLNSALGLGGMSQWRYAEFRGEKFLSDQVSDKSFAYHELELLTDEVKMHSRLRKGTSSGIRKAEREGVKVTISHELDSVREFYRLHCLTRQRHGLPPQPVLFFEKLYVHMISEGLGFTALAHYRTKAVAGLICLHFKDQSVWKYGASDERFKELSANNLVIWEAIKACAGRGLRSMSFGRSDLDNPGLISFKNGWGASLAPLKYYRYDFNSNTFGRTKIRNDIASYKKFFRYLPIDVLRMIGKFAYRHIG